MMQAYMTTMLVMLLGITVLSFVPLAGTQGGWARFHQSNITTGIMQQLGLSPWNHSIDVGYIKVCMHPASLRCVKADSASSLLQALAAAYPLRNPHCCRLQRGSCGWSSGATC